MPVQSHLAVSACRRPRPACHILVAAAVTACLGVSGGGEFPSPPPRKSVSLGFTPEVLPPWGNSFTPGVLMPLDNLTPPPTPCQPPLGFSHTTEASGTPSLLPTLEDLPDGFSCRTATLSLSPCLAPWRPTAPA